MSLTVKNKNGYFCASSTERSIGTSPSFFASLISGRGSWMFPFASNGSLLMSGYRISYDASTFSLKCSLNHPSDYRLITSSFNVANECGIGTKKVWLKSSFSFSTRFVWTTQGTILILTKMLFEYGKLLILSTWIITLPHEYRFVWSIWSMLMGSIFANSWIRDWMKLSNTYGYSGYLSFVLNMSGCVTYRASLS